MKKSTTSFYKLVDISYVGKPFSTKAFIPKDNKNNMISKTLPNKAKAVILAASVIVAGGIGTMALLSDTSTTSIEITSASLDLSVNGSSDGSYSVTMDSSNLKPGDVRTGVITVKNDSSIPITVDATRTGLTGFTSSLKDGTEDVTKLNLSEGESKTLTLSIGLPSSVTTPPTAQTLNVTFNADQLP